MKLFQLLPNKIVHLTCNWPLFLTPVRGSRTGVDLKPGRVRGETGPGSGSTRAGFGPRRAGMRVHPGARTRVMRTYTRATYARVRVHARAHTRAGVPAHTRIARFNGIEIP